MEEITSIKNPESQVQFVGLPVEFAGHEHTLPLKLASVWAQVVQVMSEPLQLPQGKVKEYTDRLKK